MPRALLAWELGGGAGHCVNLAAVAQGLLAQSWEVWVAVKDLAVARRVFGSLAVRYLQAPALVGKTINPIARPFSFAHILHNIGFGNDGELEVLSLAWRNILEAVRPDVLVCEHAPIALLVSRSFPLRRVVVGTGFFSPPDQSPLPDIRYWLALQQVNELQVEEAEILDRSNRLLNHFGTAPLERLAQLYADVDENFLLTFSELDHYPQRTGVRYWGMWSPSGGELPDWPPGNGPRLFAYLKPPSSTWNPASLLALLRELDTPTLAYIAGADPAWLQKYQSPLLQFVSRPIKIGEVGRQCSLAILNGNAGTATSLLLQGVPQLNIPLYLEQAIFSRRVMELGAGLTAAPDRPEQISARLLALLHNAHPREAAACFAARYASYDADQAIREITARIVDLVS